MMNDPFKQRYIYLTLDSTKHCRTNTLANKPPTQKASNDINLAVEDNENRLRRGENQNNDEKKEIKKKRFLPSREGKQYQTHRIARGGGKTQGHRWRRQHQK